MEESSGRTDGLDDEQSICSPAYWSRALDTSVARCSSERLPGGNSGSRVHRVRLAYAAASCGPASVICKDSLASDRTGADPNGLHREWLVYRQCLSRLPVIGPDLLHGEHSATANRLVLVDLEIDHTFRPLQHVWSREEMRVVLDTLALLHISAESLARDRDSLLMPAPDRRWDDRHIREAAHCLAADGTHGEQGESLLAVVDQLIERLATWSESLRQVPQTLLHSDFNSSNVAFQRTGNRCARLIDWHIAARGMAAFEVASLFYQPYLNHRSLDRRVLLEDYLEARYRLDGKAVNADEEWAAFCYGTAADGLSYLPPVAGQLRQTGKLAGWWTNMLQAIGDNLTWCASFEWER